MRNWLMRAGIVVELLRFLWQRRLYWLIPVMITLIAVIAFILLGSSTGIGTFFYSMF